MDHFVLQLSKFILEKVRISQKFRNSVQKKHAHGEKALAISYGEVLAVIVQRSNLTMVLHHSSWYLLIPRKKRWQTQQKRGRHPRETPRRAKRTPECPREREEREKTYVDIIIIRVKEGVGRQNGFFVVQFEAGRISVPWINLDNDFKKCYLKNFFFLTT
jgi:hypothetical protein